MGVYIIRGMTVSIPTLSFTCDEKGTLSGNIEIHVAYDACVPWAQIALDQRSEALIAMSERTRAWENDETDAVKAEAMRKEFQHASQAIVASAICMDAFYDHVARHAPIPSTTRHSWREKKVARYSQIAETLRATFRMKQSDFVTLRHFLKALFKLRDAAVHPSNLPKAPVAYPNLPIATDWRLAAFRGDVSDLLTCNCVGFLWDLSRSAKYRTKELTNLMEGFRSRWDELLPDGRPVAQYPNVTFTHNG